MQRINNIYIPKTNNDLPKTRSTQVKSNTNFQEILDKSLNKENLKISKHAEERLKERNINLTNDQIDRVKMGVAKAEEKGVKESLMLVDDFALVVSVKNKTVITAVANNELKNNVFTNIDGAVII